MHEKTHSVTSKLKFDVSIFCLYGKFPFILIILLRALYKLPKPCWDFTSYQLPQASQNLFSLWWKWGRGVPFTFFIKTLLVSKCAIRGPWVSRHGFSRTSGILRLPPGCGTRGSLAWAHSCPSSCVRRRMLLALCSGTPGVLCMHSHTHLTHTGSVRANSSTHPACKKICGQCVERPLQAGA